MHVVSVNIGEKKEVKWRNKTVETGIFKYPVNQPILLNTETVENDTIVDRIHHGGVLQAVYAYGEQHYAYWKKQYPNQEWIFGMFGENLTLTHLDEQKVRSGSIYQLGAAKLEATKPRQPCYKLGIRFNDMSIVKSFWNSTKSGVYFKVLETGLVNVNDELVLIEEKNEGATIAEIYVSKRKAKGF